MGGALDGPQAMAIMLVLAGGLALRERVRANPFLNSHNSEYV